MHGFRSSFCDWAAEVASFPRAISGAALAHVLGDATDRAYRRWDALEKREVGRPSACDTCPLLGPSVEMRPR